MVHWTALDRYYVAVVPFIQQHTAVFHRYRMLTTCMHPVPPMGGGGGNRGSLPRAPSVRGPQNSAETCSGFRSQSTTNGYCSGLRSLVTQDITCIEVCVRAAIARSRNKKQADLKNETNTMSFKSACFAFMLLGRKVHCTFYLT